MPVSQGLAASQCAKRQRVDTLPFSLMGALSGACANVSRKFQIHSIGWLLSWTRLGWNKRCKPQAPRRYDGASCLRNMQFGWVIGLALFRNLPLWQVCDPLEQRAKQPANRMAFEASSYAPSSISCALPICLHRRTSPGSLSIYCSKLTGSCCRQGGNTGHRSPEHPKERKVSTQEKNASRWLH